MLAGKTILVVDDSPIIRGVIRVYLEGRSLELLEAEDGERAWRLVRMLPVDLVIADLNMPVCDGIAFTERVREAADARLRALPVLLLTGDGSGAAESRGRAAGASGFLAKPVSAETLVAELERLLARSGATTP
jgi:two-component system chemotaxis response regulator CheY